MLEGKSVIDEISDIIQKLKNSSCYFVANSIDSISSFTKTLETTYAEFENALSAKYKFRAYDMYPNGKRFCILIDRRDKMENLRDELIIYEPNHCNSMPLNHVPEWYFNSSLTNPFLAFRISSKPSWLLLTPLAMLIMPFNILNFLLFLTSSFFSMA